MFRIWERFTELRQRRKLVSATAPFLAVFLVFANWVTLRSFVIGFAALAVYMVANGDVFGRVFFEDEKPFFRLIFGLFAFIVVSALAGVAAIFVLMNESWFLLGMVFAAGFSFFLSVFFVKYEVASPKEEKGRSREFSFSTSYILWGLYLVFLAVCLYLLLSVRSGWLNGPIWNATPPIFLRMYFIATVVLVGVILLPGKIAIKLLLVAVHSAFSLSFLVIMLYPGIIFYDPWYELGRARTLLPYSVSVSYWIPRSSFSELARMLNSFLRGLSGHVLIASFAYTLNIDMYWTGALLLPMLWGFFVPVTFYRITALIGVGKRTSILAAILTIPNIFFLAWGKLTEANSLGNLFFIFLVYLLLRFLLSQNRRVLFPIIVIFVGIGVTHFLPALVAISSVVLAFGLKRYEKWKLQFRKRACFILSSSFVISVFLVPLFVVGRGIVLPMLGAPVFSVDKLVNTSIWVLVLGVAETLALKEAIFYEVFPLLGLIGLLYVLQKRTDLNRTLCLFSLLALTASLISYRILDFGIAGYLFGAGRVKVYRDVFALPFVAIVIGAVVQFLYGFGSKAKSLLDWRHIYVSTLICFCLSAWVTASVYETYAYYTGNPLPTTIEVEALEFIDKHAQGRYVILAPQTTALIGWGFIGISDPYKKIVSIREVPTVLEMYNYMQEAGADVGYLVLITSGGASDVIAEASQIFGLIKVLSNENAEIYVFEYKVQPLPTSADVTAFYWDTPSTYNIQNDMMRVVVNPATMSIDVRDFWGDLYEGIGLNETLVNGKPLGNLTSIEYFSSSSDNWMEWTPHTEFSPAERFQFKLRFEEGESLIGVVERGNSSVMLQWESGHASLLNLRTGSFTRLYIPGLIGGNNSYDVNSHKYGFIYTKSLADNVTLHPIGAPSIGTDSLTYGDIVKYYNFSLTTGYLSYDLYIHNVAPIDQWAYIEIWLPNEIHTGSFPPLYYSVDDGATWIFAPYNAETKASQPIETIDGVDINWVFALPKNREEIPTPWWTHTYASGGSPKLPENYTDSGGAQNRMFYGFYLPAGDKILVRLGFSVYYRRPLKVSYVFRDSDDVNYGLRNMQEELIKFYNFGTSEYVGGLKLSSIPESLVITQEEANIILSISITIPSNATFQFLSAKEVATTVDVDGNGIPDRIQTEG